MCITFNNFVNGRHLEKTNKRTRFVYGVLRDSVGVFLLGHPFSTSFSYRRVGSFRCPLGTVRDRYFLFLRLRGVVCYPDTGSFGNIQFLT